MSAWPIDAPGGCLPRHLIAAQLRDSLTAQGRNTRSLAAVYGEVGHGKSTLLDDLISYAGEHGHQVVTMRGDIPDRDIPYAGLHWLISRNIDLLDRFDSPATRLLHRVLTDFTPPQSLLAMCAAVTAWFDCLAPDGPLLVAVDDADHLDEQSLRVLAFVSSRQQPGRSTIVLTSTAPIALFGRLDAQQYHLDDLARPEALSLARSVGATADVASRLVGRLGGNPLALVRVGEMVAAGTVRIHDEEPLPLPQRLETDVHERTNRLSAAARQLLEVAAVTETTDLDALDAWSRSSRTGSVGDLLADAEGAGIIEFDVHEMSWRRRWMAEGIRWSCPERRRRRLREQISSCRPPDGHLQSAAGLLTLTPSERRVVTVIVEGASTREAARRLNVSEKTIESHVQSIYRKLNVRSRSQLTAVALRG